MFYELSDQLVSEFAPSKDFDNLRIRTLAGGGGPALWFGRFRIESPDAQVQSLHATAEQHYRDRMASWPPTLTR